MEQSQIDAVFRDPKFFDVPGDDSVVEVVAGSLETYMTVVDPDGSQHQVVGFGFLKDQVFYTVVIDGSREDRYLDARDRVRVVRNKISWAAQK